MKKIFSVFVFMLFACALAACGGGTSADQKDVNAAKSALTISGVTLTAVTANFTVPVTGENDVVITWTSNKTANASVNAAGQVTIIRPAMDAADVDLVLTATLTKGTAKETKAFNVKVLKSTAPSDQEIVDAAKAALSIPATTVVADFNVNLTGAGNVIIAWASNNAVNAAVASGKITIVRPAFEAGDATAVLTATLTKGTAVATKEFTITITKAPQIVADETTTVAYAIAQPAAAVVTTIGVVSGFVYAVPTDSDTMYRLGFFLTDATGTVYAYGPNISKTIEVGNEINLTSARSNYTSTSGVTQIQLNATKVNATMTVTKDIDWAAVVKGKTWAQLTDLSVDAKAAETSTVVYEVTGKIDFALVSSSYYNVTFLDVAAGSTLKLNIFISGSTKATTDMTPLNYLQSKHGQTVTVYYIKNGTTTAGTAWRGTILKIVA